MKISKKIVTHVYDLEYSFILKILNSLWIKMEKEIVELKPVTNQVHGL